MPANQKAFEKISNMPNFCGLVSLSQADFFVKQAKK